MYRYGSDRIIVSEVYTALFFLNEMLKKENRFWKTRNLRKLKKISNNCEQKFTKNITKTAYLVLTNGSLFVIFTM